MEKKKEKRFEILSLVVLLLLFVNEDIFIFGTYDNQIFIIIRYLIQTSVFLLLLFIAIWRKKIKSLNIILLLSLMILLSMIINYDFRAGYFFMIMILFTGYLAGLIFGIDKVLDILYKSMIFISLFSVICFFMTIISPSLINRLPIIQNSNGVEFYFGLFTNILVHSGGIERNFGPFREPGVFQMFIIISMIYGFFIKKRVLFFPLIILIIALITTFSTTGYISLFFILIAIIFNKEKAKTKTGRMILFSTFGILLYLSLFTTLIYRSDGYGSVFGKLFGAYDSISMTARKSSIFVNLLIFLKNPLFGKGITYVSDNFPYLSQQHFGFFTNDNTNTLLIQFARFGVIYGFSIMLLYWKFVKNKISSGKISNVLIYISIICLLFGENLSYSFLFSFLMFSFLEDKKNEDIVYNK